MRCYAALTAAAALLLLLVPLAAAAAADSSIASYRERSEEETRLVFMEWMMEHGKAYDSAAEEERRYAIFKDKLRIVEQHNAGIHPYSLALNWLSDLSSTERCCVLEEPFHSRRTKRKSGDSTSPGETKHKSI